MRHYLRTIDVQLIAVVDSGRRYPGAVPCTFGDPPVGMADMIRTVRQQRRHDSMPDWAGHAAGRRRRGR